MAVMLGIVSKSGSWFTYGEERFQGKDKLKDLIKNNPDIQATLEKQIKEMLANKNNDEPEEVKAQPVVQKAPVTQTRAAARAKLDIAIDDED